MLGQSHFAELNCHVLNFLHSIFFLLGQIPSTGGGALTHHYTHIPLSEEFSTHTQSNWLSFKPVRDGDTDHGSCHHRLHEQPYRTYQFAHSRPCQNEKCGQAKKKMNAMWLFKTCKNELHTNNSVAFNSITPASSRGPHTPSSFFCFPQEYTTNSRSPLRSISAHLLFLFLLLAGSCQNRRRAIRFHTSSFLCDKTKAIC
jgi:hypothetical protein